MTCDQFSRAIEAALGDPRGPTTLSASARRHVDDCVPCQGRWRRTRQLIRARDRDARPSPAGVAQARRRLQQSLAEAGRPAIYYDWLRTPVGLVFVSMSDRGICDVTFGESSVDGYLARVARWATQMERDRRAVAPALDEIESYFAGRRTRFSVPVDLRRTTPFTRRVLAATRTIPFGQVASYGDVARRIGSPRGSRAVGGALGRNPVPIVVPCHRVIAQARRLGGFTGGVAVKRALLRVEGHTVDEHERLVR